MNLEEEQYIKDLELALQSEQHRSSQMASQSSSMFMGTGDINLIEWQLELDNILERIDHLLRGHVLKFDSKGNLTWQPPESKEYEIFNDYGVQEILRILSMYLNRNTILSNYKEETIDWKVYDLGIDLTDLIFMKYEEMGLNTKNKIKLYPIIIRELVDTIHSAYLRALHGGERESLRTARHVTQNDPLGQLPMNQIQKPQKKFSVFKPTTWRV